jgi:hypothetical protein
MLFAIFGLGFGASAFIVFMLICWGLSHMAKKAVSSSTVQDGAVSILAKFLKR